MATISSYDSSSISILFSGFNNNGNKNSYLGGGSDLLGINYSDYATIKNGSYFKLMRAYYNTAVDGDKEESQVNKTTSTAKDSTAKLGSIESAADDLNEAGNTLLAKGSKSLFDKTSVTGEDGKVTETYNTDAIYKAVKKFVDAYNSLEESASTAKTSRIESAAKNMTNLTEANGKILEKVGITLDEDNQLVIDEEKFKKADMSTVKSLFNTTGSYGYQVMAQASMIHYYAESEAAKSNTYGNSGNYTYNYSTGEIYNTGI